MKCISDERDQHIVLNYNLKITIMRKTVLMAVMLCASTVAMAQDEIKTILKSKAYDEALSLVKTNLSKLTDEDKAKAYNKLVDLSMEKVNKEQNIINANQMAEQLKQGKVEAYDTLGFYNAIYNALNDGIEADKYDQLPNAKGKVKPKFHTSNQNRLYNLRVYLINAGQEAAQAERNADVLKYWGTYVTSADANLFKDMENKQPDQYLGQVASFSARFAIQAQDFKLADKYLDVAMRDTVEYKEALNLKFYVAQQQLKTKEDSLNYINQLKEYYAKDTNNDMIFGTLANMYGNMSMKAEAEQLIENKLSADPNNVTALSLKGQNAMNASKWDDAIGLYKKVVSLDDKNIIILTYLGFCINSKAAEISGDVTTQKSLYKESVDYLEKARSLDPNREKANWSYPLYQCYYVLYGGNDARTKELENMIK